MSATTTTDPAPQLFMPSPDVILVWDPDVLDERRYARLVTLLGDLVRAEGGLGVQRIRSLGLGASRPPGVRP
jgi:hypothetical protein